MNNNSPSHRLVFALAESAKAAGGRALLVGGCVRDQIMGGIEPKDLDVEVFGVIPDALPNMLSSVAPTVIHVGRTFPVWKMWNEDIGTDGAIDVALPRREEKTGDHHSDFSVSADPQMSFADAAARRDFTINSIGYDPLTGEYLDPHGGMADIKAGVLRYVSPRFAEDPLRVLRGMQFAARFNLTAHPETIKFCKDLSIEGLSRERIYEEWKKLILKGKTPSLGLHFLRDTGWDRYFPEIAALKGVQQDPTWHPEGDVFKHTCHCLDAFAQRRTGDEKRDLRVGFAVLAHDFGKATHTKQENGRWVAHGHEAAGGPPAEAFLRRMTDQTDFIHGVRVLVERHMVPSSLHKEAAKNGKPHAMDASVRRLAMQLGKEGTSIDELVSVVDCDHAGRPVPQKPDEITLFRVQYPKDRPKSARPSWIDDTQEFRNTLECSGRWFGETADEVGYYLKNEYPDGGVMMSVTLNRDLAEKYRVSNIPLKPGGQRTPENPRAFSARPEKEFFLPAHIAALAAPVPPPVVSEAGVWLKERAAMAHVLDSKPKALLHGRDLIALGMAPGVSFKEILGTAFEMQLDGRINTVDDAIAYARTLMGSAIAPRSIEQELQTAVEAAKNSPSTPTIS